MAAADVHDYRSAGHIGVQAQFNNSTANRSSLDRGRGAIRIRGLSTTIGYLLGTSSETGNVISRGHLTISGRGAVSTYGVLRSTGRSVRSSALWSHGKDVINLMGGHSTASARRRVALGSVSWSVD